MNLCAVCVLIQQNSEREPQILDYQTQQYKLFPVIATCLVYNCAAKWLWDKYSAVTSQLDLGDLDQLPEVNYSLIL